MGSCSALKLSRERPNLPKTVFPSSFNFPVASFHQQQAFSGISRKRAEALGGAGGAGSARPSFRL